MSLAAALSKQSAARQFQAVNPAATKFRTSYLFDARSASEYDSETIRALGLDGLRELAKGLPIGGTTRLPQFDDFEATLFGEGLKDYDRTLHTSEENAQLDSSIALFLKHLSPYFLSKSAGKALEWLVRRFKVNELNVEEVLGCILPYHEAKQFVPMVAILRIDQNSRWNFLSSVKKSASPLNRSHMVQRCRTDKTILEFIATTALSSSKLGIRNPALDALFASTAVGLLRTFSDKPDENAIAMLLLHVLDMARSKTSPDVQAAAYIVLLQLASQVALSSEAVDGIIEVLARSRPKQNGELAIRTILYFTLTQTALTGFSNKAFKQLSDLDPAELWAAAEAMVGQREDGSSAVSAICTRFSSFLLDKFLSDPFWTSDTHHSQLSLWISSPSLPTPAIQTFTRSFLRKLTRSFPDTDEFTSIIALLEKHHRTALHSALDALSASSEIRALFTDAELSYAVPGSTANLVVDLNSADKAARIGAFSHLFGKLGDSDEGLVELAKENVVRRLLIEDEDEVLLTILEWDGLVGLFGDDLDGIEEGLRKVMDKDGKKVREAGYKALVEVGVAKMAGLEGSGLAILGELLVSKKNRNVVVAFGQAVVGAASKSPKWVVSVLTKGLKPHIDRLAESAAKAGKDAKDKLSKEQLASYNRALVELVAGNLAKRPDCAGLAGQLLAVVKGSVDSATPASRLFAVLVLGKPLSSDESVVMADLRVEFAEAAKELIGRNRAAVERSPLSAIFTETNGDDYYFAELLKKEIDEAQLGQAAAGCLHAIAGSAHADDAFLRSTLLVAMTGESLMPYRSLIEAVFGKKLDGAEAVALLSSFLETEEKPAARVAERSLRMLAAKISESGAGSEPATLVPVVLSFLGNTGQKVRAAALATIDALAAALPEGSHGKAKSSRTAIGVVASGAVREFLDDIRSRAAEITADGSHAAIFFASYFEESADARKEVCKWLIQSVKDMDSTSLRTELVQLLGKVRGKAKSSSLVPLLETLVGGGKEGAASAEDGTLLRLVLGSVDPDEINGTGKLASLFFGLLSLHGSAGLGALGKEAAQEAIMDTLAGSTFAELDEKRQADVFSHLLNLASHASHRVLQHARSCLTALPAVGVDILEGELAQVRQALFEEKKAETKKKVKSGTSDFPLDSAARDWQYLVAFLEYLQYGMAGETNKKMVGGLFELLADLLPSNGREQTSAEYAKQLTIEALKQALDVHDHEKEPIEDSRLKMDSIVQCLRSSDNPQTHSDVLILLTVIAKTHPEMVLHNIMPVFTFMGTNMLRQDDNYSFYVIRETLATLIPRLVDGKNARTRVDAIRQAKPVIQVFVDALQNIPSHRRLNLFVILVESLGPDAFLDVVFMRLLDKLVAESSVVQMGAPKENLVEFGLSLAARFGIETRMKAVVGLLTALEELSTLKAGSKAPASLASGIIFEPDLHSEKEMRQYRMVVTDFVGRLVSGREVVEQLSPDSDDATGESAGRLEAGLLSVVELLLRLITQLSASEAAFESSNLARFWKAMFKLTYTVLGKVNDLLSLPSFLKVVRRLMEHESIAIRKKVVTMFGDKVFPDKWTPSKAAAALFKDAFDQLVRVVRMGSEAGSKDDFGALQRLAIKAVSTLATMLAGSLGDVFQDAIPAVIGEHGLASAEDESAVAGMESLASLCQSLGPRALGQLPKFMPVLLAQLSAASSGRPSLAAPGLRCVLEVVDRFPQFMAPYGSELFNILLAEQFVSAKDNEAGKQAPEIAEKIRRKLAGTLPPRALLPIFATQLDKAIVRGRASAAALFRCMSTMVTDMKSDALEATYKALFKVFARGFDLRRLSAASSHWTTADVDATEADMVEAFVTVVMKLNEVLFKPMFVKLMGWASPDSTKASESLAAGRQLMFYKLVDALLDNLKTLFVPYMSLVLDQMTTILAAGATHASAQTGSWLYVVSSLGKSFIHDTEGLWKQDSRSEKLMKLLTDQLEPKGVTKTAGYADHMKLYLVPCIAEYAISAGTEKNNKTLNQALLTRCRSAEVEVRLAALWTLQAIWDRAGEDFLPLLPQTVPVLAELLEDDDAVVERTARDFALRIQDILGEDIMSYMSK